MRLPLFVLLVLLSKSEATEPGLMPMVIPLMEYATNGKFTYAAVSTPDQTSRNVGATFVMSTVNNPIKFSDFCSNWFPLFKHTDPATGHEFVLPYKSKNESLNGTPMNVHVVSKRGDCNAWRQIDIRVQTTPIPQMDPPDLKLPRIRACEEGMYDEWNFFHEEGQPRVWFTL